MDNFLSNFWQLNIELSLLLCVILFARFAIRKTTKNYNAYLLWLSIPIGLGTAKLVSLIDFQQPPAAAINNLILDYVVTPSQSINHWHYLIYPWLLVAIALLIRLAKQHKALRKDLNKISVPHNLNFNSKYPVVGIDKDGFSPAVYGFLKPRIYFPVRLERELTNEQIKLIIKHEEHHILQKHLWLNLLWDVLVCLVWFNPLIYFSRQRFRHDQEVYCDYLVLNRAPEPEHKTYGHALLSTVSATHSVSLLCSWKMFNQLEERIMSIKNVKKKSNKFAMTIGGLAIIACTSLYAINSSSFKFHESDENYRVEWNDNGKRYINNNGVLKVIENGKSREMTAKEQANFKAHFEKMEESRVFAEEELAIAEVARIEAEREMRLSEIAMEKALQEMELAQIEIERSFNSLEDAFDYLDNQKAGIDSSLEEGRIGEREYEIIREELATAREHLKDNKVQYKEDLKRAKEQLERSREQIKRGQYSMGIPKPPKPKKPNKYPKPPKDPKVKWPEVK